MKDEILQSEIETVQEAVIGLDERVEAVEEAEGDQAPAAEVAASTTHLQSLEARLEECRSEVTSLGSQMQALQTQMAEGFQRSSEAEAAAIAAAVAATEQEAETAEVTEVEIPEPASESEEAEAPVQPRNWLEKLLLVR